jgi:Mor family transcriptional regulator
VKTRDSVFGQLKAELEQQAKLEEEHLFPVLRKHGETRDLVKAALDDNKKMRALLAELDAMPKEREDFLGKLAELRKVFQQHVRDEKKELLPAGAGSPQQGRSRGR